MYDQFEKFLEYDDIPDVIDSSEIENNAKIIYNVLTSLDLGSTYVTHVTSPTVTIYKFEPNPRINVKKFENVKQNLQMALKVESVRILAPIRMEKYIGIEVSNKKRTTVRIRGVIDRLVNTEKWNNYELPIVLGVDTSNNDHCLDLANAPHLLVAGATGTGKSVFINSAIISLLMKNSPKEMELVLVDPKMVEMSFYKGIPHLRREIITEAEVAVEALEELVDEMECRYTILESKRYRNITDHNANEDMIMPSIVCIIDEFADLIMAFPKRDRKVIEKPVARIAQKARAVGIHLIIATQRPSVDVITGLIKANFATRVCFDVSSNKDSMVVMDVGGVEDLIGNGDLFFKSSTRTDLVRIQGAFLTDEEITSIVNHLNKVTPNDINRSDLYNQRIKVLCETLKTTISHSPDSSDIKEIKLISAIETYLNGETKSDGDDLDLIPDDILEVKDNPISVVLTDEIEFLD